MKEIDSQIAKGPSHPVQKLESAKVIKAPGLGRWRGLQRTRTGERHLEKEPSQEKRKVVCGVQEVAIDLKQTFHQACSLSLMKKP